MKNSDRESFAKIIKISMMTLGGSVPDPDVLSVWWSALMFHDIADVRAAFIEHTTRDKFAPKPADILEILDRIKPDSRPNAEEAWAMIPRTEDDTVVMTYEMAEAFRVAQNLLSEGDQVAARMAFKSSYDRIVETNKRNRIPPTWFPSLGRDREGRVGALAEAVRLKRIGATHAMRLLSHDQIYTMLQLAGETQLAMEHKGISNIDVLKITHQLIVRKPS